MDGYVLANHGKKRRKNRSEIRIMTFTEKMERERSSLRNDPGWLDKIHDILKDALGRLHWAGVSSLRCLGLGSPSESRSARLQLAWILELLSYANIPLSEVSLYDPVFTEEDINGFQSLGLNAVTGKEALDASHTLSNHTLLVMPHCDIELYTKVLDANWRHGGLNTLLMLGNPLDQYLLTIPKAKLITEYSSIWQIGVSQLH